MTRWLWLLALAGCGSDVVAPTPSTTAVTPAEMVAVINQNEPGVVDRWCVTTRDMTASEKEVAGQALQNAIRVSARAIGLPAHSIVTAVETYCVQSGIQPSSTVPPTWGAPPTQNQGPP